MFPKKTLISVSWFALHGKAATSLRQATLPIDHASGLTEAAAPPSVRATKIFREASHEILQFGRSQSAHGADVHGGKRHHHSDGRSEPDERRQSPRALSLQEFHRPDAG